MQFILRNFFIAISFVKKITLHILKMKHKKQQICSIIEDRIGV